MITIMGLTALTAKADNINLNCVYSGKGDIGRLADHYGVIVDNAGVLLSVDGITAKFIKKSIVSGEKQYRVGRKSFWYRANARVLRRFDGDVRDWLGDGRGNYFYTCH